MTEKITEILKKYTDALSRDPFTLREISTSTGESLDEYIAFIFSRRLEAGILATPDAQFIYVDREEGLFPVIIKCTVNKGKLQKLDKQGLLNAIPLFSDTINSINSFAANAAVYYAQEMLAIGACQAALAIAIDQTIGKDGEASYQAKAYAVSKKTLGYGKQIGSFSNLSFLEKKFFGNLIEDFKKADLTESERQKMKEEREISMDRAILNFRADIFYEEIGIDENSSVFLVLATIIDAVSEEHIRPADLKSSQTYGERDGDLLMRKVVEFLEKKNLSEIQKEMIRLEFSNVLQAMMPNISEKGESQIKRIFIKIRKDLLFYSKIGLSTDFTGKLFSNMYDWLGFSEDKLNDVVLTPMSTSHLLAKLARVNKDSYVWDFATGSAGLILAAIEEMTEDAKRTIDCPHELEIKKLKIKANQALGIEVLKSVYILALLNLALMGCEEIRLLNCDSLKDFDGSYQDGDKKTKFAADALILNPPYCSGHKGMAFVEKALSMMRKGYAAILIHQGAGCGASAEYNKRILKNNSLIASIKMPEKLFIGKANVPTRIFVFKVGVKHCPQSVVKFIDFSNDGYRRRASKRCSRNIWEQDRSKERYAELVNLVKNGKTELKIFTGKEYYESTIDPESGEDWNQEPQRDYRPTIQELKKAVSDFLDFQAKKIIAKSKEGERLGDCEAFEKFKNSDWKDFELNELFDAEPGCTLSYDDVKGGDIPVVSAKVLDRGVFGYATGKEKGAVIVKNFFSISGMGHALYHPGKAIVSGKVNVLKMKNREPTEEEGLFFELMLNKCVSHLFSYTHQLSLKRLTTTRLKITLPSKDGCVDFPLINSFMVSLKKLKKVN